MALKRVSVAQVVLGVTWALALVVLTPGQSLADPGSTGKVLVLNGRPGQVVAVFAGAFQAGVTDPGPAALRASAPVRFDGKPVEVFAPARMVSGVWIWDDATGYRFLGNVAPGREEGDIEFDAGKAIEGSIAAAPEAAEQLLLPNSLPTTGLSTVKVLVFNALPEDVIAVFQGAYVPGAGGSDPGTAFLESTTPASRDQVTELFVTAGIPSAVWIWRENSGYRFVRNVLPTDSSAPIEIDASAAIG